MELNGATQPVHRERKPNMPMITTNDAVNIFIKHCGS
jgi:hypothetical protein